MSNTENTSKSAARAGRNVRVGRRASNKSGVSKATQKAIGQIMYAGRSGGLAARSKPKSRDELLERIRDSAVYMATLETELCDFAHESCRRLLVSSDFTSNDEHVPQHAHTDDRTAHYKRLVSAIRRWTKAHKEAAHEGDEQKLTLISYLTGASTALNLAPYSIFANPWSQDVAALQQDMADVGNDLTIVWARENAKESGRRPKEGQGSSRTKQKV